METLVVFGNGKGLQYDINTLNQCQVCLFPEMYSFHGMLSFTSLVHESSCCMGPLLDFHLRCHVNSQVG